jgi:hypothetical protein
MAVAPAVVGLVAVGVSFMPFLTGGGTVPRGLVLLFVVQVCAAAILKASDYGHLVKIWLSTLICSAVLLPLLALQVTLLREPYVSWGRGSASPAVVATLVVAMVLLVGAVWAVSASWSDPDQAGLLFMPQAMVVPALIGMRSTILESPALRIFGEILLLSAAAIAVSWLVPYTYRLLTPAIAVAVEFVLLWAIGYGPWFHATSGNVVRVLYSVMLALTVILVVAVPFVALWVKHDAIAVRQAQQRAVRSQQPRPPVARGPVVPRG